MLSPLRVVLLLSLASLFFSSSRVAAQQTTTNCTVAPTCNSSAVAVPQAWFNATFSVNPATVTGATSPNYGWEATDSGDAQCTYQHTGIATFNTFSSPAPSSAQFFDLNYNTGANSTGSALPGYIGGPSAGSIAAGTAGWTFETTFLAGSNLGNAKIFCMGEGQPSYNIFMGDDGSNNAGLNFGVYDNANTYNFEHSNIVEYVNPYVPNQWYHFVAVLQQVSNSTAGEYNTTFGAWWVYVNGQLLTYPTGVTTTPMYPAAVPREAFLAKSVWNDPAWNGLIDTFRIYNYALSAAQVSTLYGGEMGGCAVPISNAAPTGSALNPNIVPVANATSLTPIYALNFTVNPLTTVSGASGYGWVESLITDSAYNQKLHTGLVTFSNLTGPQFINMALASGANSVGQVMPTVGGGSAGWSFEVMMLSTWGADFWPKVYDIGSTRGSNGNCLNDIFLGWDGSASIPDHFWQFGTCDNDGTGNQWQTGDALGEVPYNTWLHVVTTISPMQYNGFCNYYIYLNGQFFTTVNSGACLAAVPRQNAYLGKSGWSDPYFTGAIDFFNIYNQQVSDAQVAQLYAQANTLSSTTLPGSSSSSGMSAMSAGSSSSSGASTGGASTTNSTVAASSSSMSSAASAMASSSSSSAASSARSSSSSAASVVSTPSSSSSSASMASSGSSTAVIVVASTATVSTYSSSSSTFVSPSRVSGAAEHVSALAALFVTVCSALALLL